MEYRDATSALRARIESLEAELAELEPELETLRERHARASTELALLETALARTSADKASRRPVESVLLVLLLAPPAGGIAVLATLMLGGVAGSLLIDKAAFSVSAVVSIPAGLYAAYRVGRSIFASGQRVEQ